MAASTSTDFTIHNLPYGVISDQTNPTPRCATAFQDYAIDLSVLHQSGVFEGISELSSNNVFRSPTLNAFAALSSSVRKQVRSKLKEYLGSSANQSNTAFIPLSDIQNHYPMDTRNFSDFYCSFEHDQNCCAVFNGKSSANWVVQPSVYNGRTSSLVVSGTPVHRPHGVCFDSLAQLRSIMNPSTASSVPPPKLQPEPQFDFELEMGIFLSKPVPRGSRLKIEDAREHIFGFVLLNDWSARMIQFFEMAPLGPFHGKGAGTSVSPWIVTTEALDEVAACARHTKQTPAPLPHLWWQDESRATYDVNVSARVVRKGTSHTTTMSNLNELHWTPFQQIVHLSLAGEGLSTGDIFGTGTMSSARTNSAGEKTGLACLWERKLPHAAKVSGCPDDLSETLLLDGDEVVFEAWVADQNGEKLLGFGQCSGVVLPAV